MGGDGTDNVENVERRNMPMEPHICAYIFYQEVECIRAGCANLYYEYACTLFDESQMCTRSLTRHERNETTRE